MGCHLPGNFLLYIIYVYHFFCPIFTYKAERTKFKEISTFMKKKERKKIFYFVVNIL